MAIAKATLSQEEYENFRYELIKLVEESGHENLNLYADSVSLVSTSPTFGMR
jgi:hypothetical protein